MRRLYAAWLNVLDRFLVAIGGYAELPEDYEV